MDKTPAPAAAPQNVRRERVTAASLFRPVDCARRQPIELKEAERIAPTLISEQHEEAAYRFPEGRIPGLISCRALRQLRPPARSQSRYLRWVRVVDHVQDAAEPAIRHFHLTRLDTHIAGGAGVRVACRPATELHSGSTDRGKPRRPSSLSLAGSKPYSPPADALHFRVLRLLLAMLSQHSLTGWR